MKTQEFPSYPKNTNVLEKINLRDGEAAYFDGEKYQAGFDPDYGYPYAKADTFIIGKNGPKLEARGGDCAVISLYEAGGKIGAVIHIDVAYIGNKDHLKDLLDRLVQTLGGISPETTDMNVFVDVEDAGELAEAARRWHQMIMSELKVHFHQIASFTEGNGKYVRLDTRTGNLEVFDDDGKLIFSKKMI